MKVQQLCFISFLVICISYSCKKSENENILSPNTTYKLRLKGQAKTCNNLNLSNGYLFIASNNGISSIFISNGNFDSTFQASVAFDSVLVYAIDLDSLKASDTLIIAVNSDSINLGIVNACTSEVDEYINFKINNEKHVFVPAFNDTLIVSAWDTLNAPTTYLYRNDGGNLLYNCRYRRTQFNGMSIGTFGVNWNSSIQIGRYYSFNLPSTGRITYSSYGLVGDYIIGNLNVPFVDYTDSMNYLLTGTFKVRRDH